MEKNNQIESKFESYFAKIKEIFIDGFGYKNSVENGIPVDEESNPIPLYSYPAIEYLNSLNFENKEIFEFGSGQSTLYWLNKKARVTSVESNPKWFDAISSKTKNNDSHKYIFCENDRDYINSITKEGKFDVIIIDGSVNRYYCTKNAIKSIKEDGLIIIDNSDWFENSTKLVRDELDFIQVDFYGFRPSKSNTSVTSLFFSRSSNFKALSQKQPNFAVGGKHKHSQNDKI